MACGPGLTYNRPPSPTGQRPEEIATSKPVRVALDPELAVWAPEVKYTLKTLLRMAGYPCAFAWAEAQQATDLYYGRAEAPQQTALSLSWSGLPFGLVGEMDPEGVVEWEGLRLLQFSGGTVRGRQGAAAPPDPIFSAFWMLTGAREPSYPRSRADDLDLEDTLLWRERVLERPLVSECAAWLGHALARTDRVRLPWPWVEGSRRAVVALSHDVDYPELLRWIEPLRLLARRGLASWRLARDLFRDPDRFWRFDDWMRWEASLGARSAFYFMARRGSPWRYAAGTPDAFYDATAPRFRRLMHRLHEAGFEIGLHASFDAYRQPQRFAREKRILEEAAGVAVAGNRHHYWHLDPAAPEQTLEHAARAGFRYDSSLALEYYPGFRRGVCHPFRPFHRGYRREIPLVEVPPTWMDDHYDGRLARNRIEDPARHAGELLGRVRALGGVAVLDYHVRGMDAEVFPRWGPWLVRLFRQMDLQDVVFTTPARVAEWYEEHERKLEADSKDAAVDGVPYRLPGAASAAVPRVALLERGGEPEWEAYVERHAESTLYHTLAWRRVTERGYGYEPYYFVARREGRVCGVLPTFVVRGLSGRRLVSVPLRDRGSVLADDAESAALLLDAAIEACRDLDCGHLELKSVHDLPERVREGRDLICCRDWVSTRVDLSIGLPAYTKRLDRRHRRGIRSAGKSVRVEQADRREQMDVFYELFSRTRTSMGIPTFPRGFFHAVWDELVQKGMGQVWLATHDGRPVHGMVGLLHKRSWIGGYAAPQRRYSRLGAGELLLWRIIEWAAENGFDEVDFGADSFRQSTLADWKRKWRPERRWMYYYYVLHRDARLPDLDSSSARYRVMRAVWSRLPLPLAKALGGAVTRRLG